MDVAVIGLGNIGSRVARNLTAGGQKVIVTDKTLARAESLAKELGGDALPMTVADAVGKAGVFILAIYFDAIKQFIAANRGALAGKIVVDPSNPIAPDGKGGSRKRSPPKIPQGSSFPPSSRKGATRQSIRHAQRRIARVGSEPLAQTGSAVLRDGPSGGWPSRGTAYHGKRIFAGQRRRRRPIYSNRSWR
jgi:hypothetical protein